MTLFDLLFLGFFFTTVVMLVAAAVSALRRRRARATALLRWLGTFVAAYLGVVILVSLVSPRRVLDVGDEQCFDDWCIAVTDVRREPSGAGVRYALTLRVSSRARRRPQRERGIGVYLMDDRGRCYDPVPDPEEVPFDVLLRPGEAVNITRVVEVPAEAERPVLVVSHGGGFPGCFIIGDSESLFHKRTVVRLD
jgi:hypothetical protein